MEKDVIIYKFNDEKSTCKLYNGKGYKTVTSTDFRKRDTEACVYIPVEEDLTLKESYEIFIRKADALKKASKGLINLYITGRDTDTALDFFYRTIPHIQPDPIGPDESEFIENCRQGPIMFGEEHEGKTYQYDFKSFYPSIMLDNHFTVPIKKGELKTLTEKEFNELKFYQIGIYRCKIEVPSNKLFRHHPKNHYTQIDLRRAKELGYKMKIIVDGKPNFLYYARDKVMLGCHVFKEYVDLLFKMKEDNIEGAKEILNNLWGIFGQLEVIKIYYNIDDEKPADIAKNRIIKNVTSLTETRLLIELVKKDRIYRTDFARMVPFLLAKGRYLMSKALEPHLEFVKRVHTDSMFTTQLLKDENGKLIQTGHELGDLSYKGKCMDCHIYNSVKYTGKFSY
jgi:hypothetical protein